MTTWTIEEAATVLKVNPETIRRQLRAGKMRGVKVGRQWRLFADGFKASEKETENVIQSEAERIWRRLTSEKAGEHNEAILELARAPKTVQEIVMRRSSEMAEAYYQTPEGREELADWRALDGEPFLDESGDYYTPEEEAQFRAEKIKKQDEAR